MAKTKKLAVDDFKNAENVAHDSQDSIEAAKDIVR